MQLNTVIMTVYIKCNDDGKTSTIKMNISFNLIQDGDKIRHQCRECINHANTFSKYYETLYITTKQLVNKFV